MGRFRGSAEFIERVGLGGEDDDVLERAEVIALVFLLPRREARAHSSVVEHAPCEHGVQCQMLAEKIPWVTEGRVSGMHASE
jgi:hypothetical protein